MSQNSQFIVCLHSEFVPKPRPKLVLQLGIMRRKVRTGTGTDPRKNILFNRAELHLKRQGYRVILISKHSVLCENFFKKLRFTSKYKMHKMFNISKGMDFKYFFKPVRQT